MTKQEAIAYLELTRQDETLESAEYLLNWVDKQEKDGVSRALVHYLIYYVFPVLRGEAVNQKEMPAFVFEALFRQDPTEAALEMGTSRFLSYFPGTVIAGLSDVRDKPGRQIEMREWDPDIVSEAKAMRYAVFFTPNAMGDNANENGNLRHNANTSAFNAVFVDYDAGRGPEVIKALSSRLPPSAIVETKKGYHVYWLLDRSNGAITDADAWQVVQDAAILVFGGDPAAKNSSRLLRVPGTWHCKDVDAYLVKLLAFTGRAYTLQELALAFDVGDRTTLEAKTLQRSKWRQMAMEARTNTAKRLTVVMPRLTTLGEGQRHGTANEEVARMYANLDESLAAEARNAAVLWYQNSCSPLKRNWEEDIHGVVDWVEEREFGRRVSFR